MKRWLAFVLICVFFINILPFQAAAAEDEFVYISVIHNGHEKTYRVIKAGAQLLFAGEDLASFGGYTYRVEGDNAYFTRGMKTIRVNMARSSLIPYDGTTYSKNQKNITLKTAVCNVDGTNYFPGTQLLPWLSVNCSVEAGKLKITSDEITIWELLKEFDPDDYTFDFAKCCEELGEKSKWVKAWAGLQGLGFDAILGWLPSLGGNSKEEHNYYDIFEDMLQDQTCSESSLDELMDDTDKFNQWMEWIEIIGMEEELPDELRAMGAIFKVVGSAPAQLSSELGFYLTTMDQDNEDKLNALKYIVLQGSGFPESMDAAAQTIIVEYEDRILGILGKGIDILMDGLKDLMGDMGGDIFKIVLKFIDLPELVSVECSEGIRRVEFYDTIAKGSATAYKEERDKLSDTAVSSMGIQDARSMAYLYLYASEQNWRAMYEYAMYQEKYELANEYALCADAAEEMAAKFLASAYAQLNDSPKYGDAEVQRKQEYTDQLKEMFANISFYSSQADMLFDETYWVWTTGETAGSRYVVLFHKDGTMEYCSATNQGYGVMSYTYDNDLLTVNGADYRWDGEYFLSTEKMESQDPNGMYYSFSLDSDGTVWRPILEEVLDARASFFREMEQAQNIDKRLAQVKQYTSGGGILYDFKYDADGLLTEIVETRYGSYQSEYMPDSITTTLVYDDAHRLLSRTRLIQDEWGTRGEGAEYTYNSAGKLIASTYGVSEGGGGDTSYEYDVLGYPMIITASWIYGEEKYHYAFDSDAKTMVLVKNSWVEDDMSDYLKFSGSESYGISYQYKPFVVYGNGCVYLLDGYGNGNAIDYGTGSLLFSLSEFGLSNPKFYCDEDGYLIKVIDESMIDESMTYELVYE